MTDRGINLKLIGNLLSVKEDYEFIKPIVFDLDTNDKKLEMIEYIESRRQKNKKISISDILLKDMQIMGVVK